MNTILILIASIVYILALLCLAVIVFLPGVGFWFNSQGTGYAFDIPEYLRIICLILLILLLGGGLYLLSRGILRLT